MVANQSSPTSSGPNPNPTPKVRAKFVFAHYCAHLPKSRRKHECCKISKKELQYDGGKKEEARSILIGLMNSLGVSKVRIMLYTSIIRAYDIEEEMINWVAIYHEKVDSLTIEAFVSKLNELTGENAQETD